MACKSVYYIVPEETLNKTNKSQLSKTPLENCTNPNRFEMVDGREKLACSQNLNGTAIKEGVIMRNLEKMNQFAVLFGEFMIVNNEELVNINETITI